MNKIYYVHPIPSAGKIKITEILYYYYIIINIVHSLNHVTFLGASRRPSPYSESTENAVITHDVIVSGTVDFMEALPSCL